MTAQTQNPIEQARVLQGALDELQADLLEQAHSIASTLLLLPESEHDNLGAYQVTLLPLLKQYKQHQDAFANIEQTQDAQDKSAPLVTITKALDALALDVLAVVTKPPNRA